MRTNHPNPTLGLGCLVRRVVNVSLGILVAWLSVPVVINLLSSKQVMNTSFNPLRIVNTYGAFGRYGPGILPGALGSAFCLARLPFCEAWAHGISLASWGRRILWTHWPSSSLPVSPRNALR